MQTYREWFNEQTLLTEMATDRKKAEKVINGLGDEIFKHLIKILYWVDDINYNKHCSDINSWLYKIQDIELKPNSKRISAKDYYFWLYDEFYSSKNQLNSTIKRKLKDYHNLARTNITEEELYTKLKIIYENLCVDLNTNKFEDIKDYL